MALVSCGATAAIVLAVACHDNTPTAILATPPPSVRTSVPAPGVAAHRSMAELHRRNPMDWVGVAHNRAVDLFARELHAHHLRPGHLCDDLVRITVAHKNDILPQGHRNVSDADWKRGAQGGCGRRGPNSGDASAAAFPGFEQSQPVFRATANSVRAPFEYEDAAALLNATADAVATFDDPIALGDALNGIMDSANQLSDTAATQIVQAAVAVASNSYDYWASHGDQLAGDVDATYGTCLRSDYGAYGDENRAYSDCVQGGQVRETGAPGRARARGAIFSSVAFRRSPAPFCGLHRKSWAAADAATFALLELGALITTGPLGALMVSPLSAGSAGSASVATMVGDVFSYLFCLM